MTSTHSDKVEMNRINSEEMAEKVLQRLKQVSDEIDVYLREKEYHYSDGGLNYTDTDEEESCMQGILTDTVRGELPSDFPHKDYIHALGNWTNGRRTYPKEWIHIAIKEVLCEK